MSLAPPLVVTLGLITLLVLGGHWLMKPTVARNPGVAAYQPPAATVLDYGSAARLVAVERASNEVAEKENAKLGLRPALVAGGQSQQSVADGSAAAAPAPKAKTARVQKRQDASGQSQARAPQREPAPFSAFARGWFARF